MTRLSVVAKSTAVLAATGFFVGMLAAPANESVYYAKSTRSPSLPF